MGRKLKILLIHTYTTYDRDEFIQTLSEPLGLLSLAAYINSKFHDQVDVNILDLYAMGFDTLETRKTERRTRGLSDEKKIKGLLEKNNPDIVGIQCNFTGFSVDALEVAAIVKKTLPHTLVVIGGAHVSYLSKNILEQHPCIDYIVRGEGEITLYELTKAIMDGGSVSDIKGIAYRDKQGNVVMTPARELIQDIDSLPIPDRKYIDMQKYLHLNKFSFPLAKKYPVATVMASRGCPYNCIFCSTKNMWGRVWRGRSPESIVREIQDLVADYGVKEVAFYDDQFLVSKKWVHDICDLIIKSKLGISLTLPSGTSVWMADEGLLRKMKKAGFYRLHLPIESGNQNTIKFIRKPVNLEAALETIRCACKIGFWTSANFILGFPYETKEEIRESIAYAYNCGIDYPFFFVARPYVGAELYDICEKEGLLKDNEETMSSVFVAKSDTLYLKAEELRKIRADAESGFLGHKVRWSLLPRNFINYILPKFFSVEDMRYTVKILFSLAQGKHKRE